MQQTGASTTTNTSVSNSSSNSHTAIASKGRSSGSKFQKLLSKLHRNQPSGSAGSSAAANRATSPPANASSAQKQSQKQPLKAVSNGNAVKQSVAAGPASQLQPSSASAGEGNGPGELLKSPSPAQQVKEEANRDAGKPSDVLLNVRNASINAFAASSTNADNSATATTTSDEYLEPGEEDGADANASLRPHTPSTIDASSSFTGSRRNSNGSLAPTSRTFKSFVTGHSKTSASTKPTTLAATSSNTVPASSTEASPAKDAGPGSGDMREEGANRIATQLHEQERSNVPTASTGTGEAAQIMSERPVAVKPSPLRNSIEGLDGIPLREASEASSSSVPAATPLARPNFTSSNSITFSALPPASPSLQQQPSTPASPLMPSSASVRSFSNSLHGPTAGPSGSSLTHYPRHSHHDPKNNPRASSPPPDNASILTLASSTAPSVYGSVRTPGVAESERVRHKSSLGAFANEDASIRAIAPSRRESGDSLGSKWSAAILSTRDTNRDGKESYYTASVINGES